jgi:hypothetical protein
MDMVVQTLKTGLNGLFTALLDTIEAFSDYFILKKRVTLSETSLFMFSLAWTVWFVFVGVYVSEMAMSRAAWATVFALATISHLISFFIKDIIVRAFVVSTYAVTWFFLMLLSAYTGSIAPAVPTLLVCTYLAVFVSVRLFRERQNRE